MGHLTGCHVSFDSFSICSDPKLSLYPVSVTLASIQLFICYTFNVKSWHLAFSQFLHIYLLVQCVNLYNFYFTSIAKSQCNECQGPGYATPIEAMATAPREKLVYLPCIQIKAGKRDYLATVNIDPSSTEYCKV